eukprot:8599232-Pyramimonas_sp.AAC.1
MSVYSGGGVGATFVHFADPDTTAFWSWAMSLPWPSDGNGALHWDSWAAEGFWRPPLPRPIGLASSRLASSASAPSACLPTAAMKPPLPRPTGLASSR